MSTVGEEKRTDFLLWLNRRIKNKYNTKLYLILCFAVPFLLMGIAFAFYGVYPFGDRQILVVDFWQQYFSFHTELQNKLQTGQSLFYSWNTGMGSNFWAIGAYYYASPFNLLLKFIPYVFLREALALFLLCRIGFAGLFCGVFLKGVFKRNNISIVFFSTMYALCAFTLGYYWNIMWFDTFALFPLVAYGTYSLVKYGRVRLYIISLSMSLLFNYHIGFFTCIFTAIFFFCLCIEFKISLKLFFRRFAKITISSIVSVSMSLVMLLPELFALGISYSTNKTNSQWPSIAEFRYNLHDIIGNFAAMNPPTDKEGLPNIYCGFICVILLAVFILSKKIRVREKILFITVLIFLLFSIENKLFDFIWHGFHSTNMIPHRFSFIVSFVLVVLAYRAFTMFEDITSIEIIGMLGAALIVILCALFGQQTETAVYVSIVLSILYIGIFFMYERKIIPVRAAYLLIGVVLLSEMLGSVMLSVKTVRTTSRSDYPDKHEAVRACIEDIKANDSEAFYRMEFSKFYTLNDPPLYQYPGVSQFSSIANVSVTNFLEGIGNLGWDAGNRYYYSETTPISNAFLDLKYLIAKDAKVSDINNWSKVGTEKGVDYYKNNRYLSLGFMTDKGLKDFKADKSDPFKSQQELFEKSTGIKENLFDSISVSTAAHKNLDVTYRGSDIDNRIVYGQYRYSPKVPKEDSEGSPKLSWNYIVPKDCSIYLYAKIDNVQSITVSKGEGELSRDYDVKRPYIVSAGVYKLGDKINISASVEEGLSGKADIYVCMLNQGVFDRGYETLRDELFRVTSIDSTNVCGDITVNKGGLLYMSIPYESGWSAYVDGIKTEITSVDNAMIALELNKGKHKVEFRYLPAGFKLGLIISLSAAFLFVLFCLAQCLVRKKIISLGPLGRKPEIAGLHCVLGEHYKE